MEKHICYVMLNQVLLVLCCSFFCMDMENALMWFVHQYTITSSKEMYLNVLVCPAKTQMVFLYMYFILNCSANINPSQLTTFSHKFLQTD